MITSLTKKYEVEQRIDIKIRMRDGVRLSTDIYLPKGKGPFPVILSRTPYGNHDSLRLVAKVWFAQRGFVYAFQDCRGRHDSEGEWEPFRYEKKDAFDTISWLAKQDFSNGNIGMMGGSYEGYTSWMGAASFHPKLKAIVPLVALPDPVINVPYQNGAFFWNMIVWGLMVFGKTNQNLANINWNKFYTYLPLRKLDEAVGMQSRTWQNWMDHPTFDKWWKEVSYMHLWNKINIPALHICGWYDDDGISTYKNFPGMRARAKTPKARDAQKLIIGCWAHKLNVSSKVGEIDFGPKALIDMNSIILKFFARHLTEEVYDKKREPRGRIFIMGENKWHGVSDWPIPKAVTTEFYLHSNGNANSLLGDGVMSEKKPSTTEKTDRYTYDPKDPVPYVTDPISLQLGEACDQQAIERRMDVLVYSTPPLKKDVIICGRVFAELYVSTDVKGTDFTGKLVDVWPNGKAIQLCDGIQRAEFRNSLEKPEWLSPGKVYKVTVDMWATGMRFLKGHQIRLEISSSAVPKFSPHLNTDTDQAYETKPRLAHQAVYHTKDYPSALVVDVVPEKALGPEIKP
ncbi:MAG: CocE/NonD family hydrolase [Planctomycetes bacterium]|nr:CocE/NonD family hydrolase [Planctomycetota bacterium]